MTYSAGDFLEVREGVTVRLNKDTAEIANAAAFEGGRDALEKVHGVKIGRGDISEQALESARQQIREREAS